MSRSVLIIAPALMLLTGGCSLLRTDRLLHAAFSAHACCLSGGVASHFGAGDGTVPWTGFSAAMALGLLKEISDAGRGSGFDTVDLLADLAGSFAGFYAVERLIVED